MQNSELFRMKQQVIRKKELDTRLESLCAQQRAADKQMIDLRVKNRMAQEGLKGLEQKSFGNFLRKTFGGLKNEIVQKRADALAAAEELALAEKSLADTEREIRDLRQQQNALRGCESAYAAALQKKREELASSGSAEARELLTLETTLSEVESRKKDIRESAAAGQEALRYANAALAKLGSASELTSWDMLGGNRLVDYVQKHEHMDSAQAYVEALQNQLQKFQTELTDIRISADFKVNAGGFMRYADYFMDGLLSDFAVKSRIKTSRSAIESVRGRIQEALDALSAMEQKTDGEIAEINTKIEELVIKA